MLISRKKTYLSQQVRLISLKTNDLFTDEEYDIYQQILGKINLINDEEEKEDADPTVRLSLISEKKELFDSLRSAIVRHDGKPRTVRIKSVVNYAKFRDENGEIHWPEGVTWDTLKLSRRVAEFVSSFTRALGLKDMDICIDKIIISWKNPDILRQIVLDGFYLPIDWGDCMEHRHYRFMTASAGQLRTDKIQCVSDKAWEQVSARLLCGLTWEEINRRGGINVNKLMAYIALGTSATDLWDISIDHFIVIKDFEAPVTGIVDFIDNDYKMTRREATTVINHCDGIGMMLPRVSRSNFMVRGPWLQWSLCTVMCIKNVVN